LIPKDKVITEQLTPMSEISLRLSDL